MSQKWAPGSERTTTDGSTWSVNPDWEERTSLIHNLFELTTTDDNTEAANLLETHFMEEPLFQHVVLAICDKDHALVL